VSFWVQALKLQAQAHKGDGEGVPYQPASRNNWDFWLRGIVGVSKITQDLPI
jgi:hypothetical protein